MIIFLILTSELDKCFKSICFNSPSNSLIVVELKKSMFLINLLYLFSLVLINSFSNSSLKDVFIV